MLAIERQKIILDKLHMESVVTVTQLSKELLVTEETIRRDLEKLETTGALKRTRGGAYLPHDFDHDIPVALREIACIPEKEMISEKCLEFIDNGDNIMLDSSTTALYIAKKIIKSMKEVTLITNSLKIMNECVDADNVNLISIGGKLRRTTQSYVGYMSVKNLENFFADKAFVSCSGVSIETGLTDNNELEAEIRKIMLRNSNNRFFVADNIKFNKSKLFHIVNLDEIHRVVTDQKLSKEWEKILKDKKISYYYCIDSSE